MTIPLSKCPISVDIILCGAEGYWKFHFHFLLLFLDAPKKRKTHKSTAPFFEQLHKIGNYTLHMIVAFFTLSVISLDLHSRQDIDLRNLPYISHII